MNDAHFIQIHTLTAYPASLLNRDDVGFAKRIPFGGEVRTRISSQCLKRHWRRFEGEHALSSLKDGEASVDLSVRSRLSFEQFVLKPLIKEGVNPDLARAATEAVMEAVLGVSAKAKRVKEEAQQSEEGKKANAPGDEAKKAGKKGKKAESAESKDASSLQTGQVTVLGRPELEYFLREARELAKKADKPESVSEVAKEHFKKDWSKNLEGLRLAAGIDAALFGRMVTSDKLSRADAAIHVAHAFTVHKEHSETDYFSAVDDLLRGGDAPDQLGSGHIGTSELTTGLFYGYVVVDVPLLVSNLEGCAERDWKRADRKLAAKVVESLVHLVTRVSPGAKLGSTAPYAYAHLAMIETGRGQPRTLANAFFSPVRERPNLLANAYEALVRYVSDVDHMYGSAWRRAIAATGPREALDGLGPTRPLADVAKFAAGSLLEAG